MTQKLQELCPFSESTNLTISSVSLSLPNTVELSTRELDCGRSEIPTQEGGRTNTCLCGEYRLPLLHVHTFG
uniref:Uncharacterized protein n=1 Tax=Oryza brachyantha TaxID=4533 RepID=J3L525_ORYBR